MSLDTADLDFDLEETAEEGGSIGLAILAAAIGAGAALLFAPIEGSRAREFLGGEIKGLRGDASKVLTRLQREVYRRRHRDRRQAQIAALAGLVIGAGLTALLTPASGPEARRRITERLRQSERPQAEGKESPGESTAEAGRNAEQVF
jgi:gas vesicle protein